MTQSTIHSRTQEHALQITDDSTGYTRQLN